MPALSIAIDTDAEPLVVRLDGALDLETVDELYAAAERLPAGRSVTYDLRGLTFADSSALHAIGDFDERARDAGTNVRFVVSNPTLLKAFDVVGYLGRLNIEQVTASPADADTLDL